MKAAVELMRPLNCVMAGTASIIGALIAYQILDAPYFEPVDLATAFFVVVLVTGAGNAVNDYFDARIDAINRPDRPIPSGRITPRAAYLFSMALFLVGIGLTVTLNSLALAIAAINAFILYYYAHTLKRTPFAGNLAVAYLTGSTFLFGGSILGPQGLWATGGLFLLATLATLGREIVKDIEDLRGDQESGAHTLPIVIGVELSTKWAAGIVAFAVLLSPLPYLYGMLGPVYLGVVAAADAGFAYSINLLQNGDYTGSSQALKASMGIALLAFIAGALL